MKFEYCIFNMSEAKAANKTWLAHLNKLGSEGWEVVFKLTDHSYLMKKVIST